MKHLLAIVFALLLVSCGTSKAVRTSKKVIKGNWNLSSIDYSKTGVYNVTLFNDASKDCFINSNWQFIPNNNTGTYTITDTACNTGERYFIFSIDEVNPVTGLYDFLLKPTTEKGRSETNQGYRMELTLLTETAMQWQQTINVDGSAFLINMNFTKK